MSNIEVHNKKLYVNGKKTYSHLNADLLRYRYISENKQSYQFIDLKDSDGKHERTLVVHNDDILERSQHTIELLTYKTVFSDIYSFVQMHKSGKLKVRPYKMETKLYNILKQFKEKNNDPGIQHHIENIMLPYHSFTCLDKIAENSVTALDTLLVEISDEKQYDHPFLIRFAGCYIDTYSYPIKYETEVEKYRHRDSAKELLKLIKEKKVKMSLLHKPFITITLKTFAKDSETETVLQDLAKNMENDLADASKEEIVEAAIVLMIEDAKKYAKTI